ncbi:PfkB family carbohydrate kinase [Amaricoccus sp.]|uniref:PfkB family carbohydrate kinase n=1 Tax=Amaricoccus sp. TaxID=1872485 RepID=UPI0025BA8D36|nr:PfkB family carbohydrate kinase [Amaricoccus sp.]
MIGAQGQWALCVGAAHWDVIARSTRPLLPGNDAPGTVAHRPGGVALNVALALAALGRPAAILGVVGADAEGARLIEAASARGVDCASLLRRGATDRYVAIEGPDGALVAAVADCAGLDAAGDALAASPALARRWPGPVVADGNLAPSLLARLAETPAAAAGLALVPASPAKAVALADAPCRGRATIYLNRAEAEAALGAAQPSAAAAAAALRARGWAAALVTDGPRAAAWDAADGAAEASPPAVAARSVTGAGDVLVAAHLVARAKGRDPAEALGVALAAAAAHVSRPDPSEAP